jgi:hypothetical protein
MPNRIHLLLLLALGACQPGARDVTVEITLPAANGTPTPLADLPVIALPYDRDSVIAAMETRAARPRPHAAALDSLFAAFAAPFAGAAEAGAAALALERELAGLRGSLDSMPRGAPDYAAAYGRFGRLSDSLARVRARQEEAQRALAAVRRRVQPRVDSLREAVRAWEDSIYAGYDTLTEGLAKAARRPPLLDSTDASGLAHFRLTDGRWWIYARSWDSADPNREWYWNVPVVQDTDTIRLDASSGRRRARY